MSLRLGAYVRMLHSCTDQAMTNALTSMELTAAQGHIMGFIQHQEKPPCSRDIEQEFHLSHPTVSGLLTRLEKKGFLEFRTDALDHRCKRIYILPKGEQVHETMRSTIISSENQMVQGFSPEEIQQFTLYLQRALNNMGVHPCKQKHKEEVKTDD